METRLAAERIAGRLSPGSSVLVITGSGMSADSGLPTYRGAGGLYEGRTTADGVPIEVALSGPMFRNRPGLTWRSLLELAHAARGARFNRGHAILAEMEGHFGRFWILTQNVDGFHQDAGSRNVIAIHGDLRTLECVGRCGWRERVSDYDEAHIDEFHLPPHCPRCGAIIRPRVVLFEEALPGEEIRRLHEETARGFDAVFSVGTTSAFPYIAAPVLEGRRRGALTVEINPGDSEIAGAFEIRIRDRATPALEAIWGEYRRSRGLDVAEVGGGSSV